MAPVARCPSRCPAAAQATTTAIPAANGGAAPIAIMPAATQSHRGTSKVHGGKSHGSPQTLTRTRLRPGSGLPDWTLTHPRKVIEILTDRRGVA
jgi:hypothetical protein